MTKRITKITWMFLGLVLACFAPLTTHAQAETAPDEYKSSNMAPATPAPSAKTDFQGHFSLPYTVQCHGHKLAPGQYTLMVKTLGEEKIVALHQEGTDVVLECHPVTPIPVSDQGHSAVMLRHGPGPSGHTLEGAYLENLKLHLVLDESGHQKFLDKIFGGIKRVPIS